MLINKKQITTILTTIGIHNWHYKDEVPMDGSTRVCKWCGKLEVYVFECSMGAFGDSAYWVVDIDNRRNTGKKTLFVINPTSPVTKPKMTICKSESNFV